MSLCLHSCHRSPQSLDPACAETRVWASSPASLRPANPSLQPAGLTSELWTEGGSLLSWMLGGVVQLESAHTGTHNLQCLGSGSFNTSILTHHIYTCTHTHALYVHTHKYSRTPYIHTHTHTHTHTCTCTHINRCAHPPGKHLLSTEIRQSANS